MFPCLLWCFLIVPVCYLVTSVDRRWCACVSVVVSADVVKLVTEVGVVLVVLNVVIDVAIKFSRDVKLFTPSSSPVQ